MKAKMYVMLASAVVLVPLWAHAEQGRASQEPAKEESDAEEPVALESDNDRMNYVLGIQAGYSLKTAGIKINRDAFIRGVEDILAERELALSQAELRQIIGEFQSRMRAKETELLKKEGEKNLAEGRAFLEENKKNPGVTVLPSGLQYKVLQEGTGRTPAETDTVRAHYRGRLINGDEFDNSYERGKPLEYAVNGLIKGWAEALLLMKEGSKWQLFIPPDLAYGERGRPGIPPNATLIFEIELIEVVD